MSLSKCFKIAAIAGFLLCSAFASFGVRDWAAGAAASGVILFLIGSELEKREPIDA